VTERLSSQISSVAAPPVAWRDPVVQILVVDILAVLVAAALPWSTSGVAIFMVLWFVALVPTVEPRSLLQSLKRPASVLPLAFFALAIVGTLWSEGAWPDRIHGISPVAKLVAIPFLFYHFGRSRRGTWVFVAFFVSCALLMGLS
jgi:O-antigen ligase